MDKKMDKKEKLSFLKRQFRYLQIKQQQKLLEKKIEEKIIIDHHDLGKTTIKNAHKKKLSLSETSLLHRFRLHNR